MKVLYLIDTLEVGGTEKSLLEIAGRLGNLEAVLCHIYPGEALKPKFEEAGIRVISLNVGGKYSFFRAARKVLGTIKEERPDVVHSALYRAGIAGRIAGRIARLPLVDSFVNESYASLRLDGIFSSAYWKLKGLWMLDYLTARWVFLFTANSEAVKEANCRDLKVSPDDVKVIYRGRDPADYLGGNEGERQKTRSSLGLGGESFPVILNVSRILLRKGHEEMVSSMPTILREFPDAVLLMAGDGPRRGDVEEKVRRMGLSDKVRLLGQRADIPALLSMADLFVFPSHYEGHPGALVEAMLSALPCVASDIPVHRECITHEETGLLVKPKDPEALTGGILRMMKNPKEAKKMGEAAREKAVEKFDISLIARMHEALYKEVIERRAGGR